MAGAALRRGACRMTLEPKLADPVQLAIPAFILLVLLEIGVAKLRREPAYEIRDTAASLAMGLGNLVIGAVLALGTYVAANWVYQYRLLDLGYAWWSFALVLFAEDLTYYWFHRLSHRSRFWWAAHINHHSSQHYRNYAGVLIIWDRLFSSFVPEDEREPCRYGIVKNIGTFNPLRIAFHEWAAIGRDLARAPSWRARLAYAFGQPGWSPDGSRQTTDAIRAQWQARRDPAG